MATTGYQREFHFTDEHFQQVVELIYAKSGISLSDKKTDMVYGRLARRLRKVGLDSFQKYIELVKHDEAESVNFVNSLTTNLTHFFRENHHFDYLSDDYFPELLNNKQKKIRAWSAGCSTGEEPYSLGLLWQVKMGRPKDIDFKILATDLDTNVLESCKKGIYSDEKLENIEPLYQPWFKQTSTCNKNQKAIYPKLRDFIYFKQLNLMTEWPMKGPFDLIICRNVLIYFDRATQEKLVRRFYDLLAPNACLILGHSEKLSANKELFEPIGQTIFRKL